MSRKLTRNTSTPDAAEFWRFVDEIAEEARGRPAWERAGIAPPDVEYYETWPPVEDDDDPAPLATAGDPPAKEP